MSGVHGAFIGHVVKRGMHHAHKHMMGMTGMSAETMGRLQNDAELYEKSGQEVKLQEMIPMLTTVVVAILIIASVRYTIGEVMASLAMIESPSSSTAIVEPKGPPAYTVYADEADAPLEKEPLMPAEAEADVEVMVVNHKPITSKITTTMGHLQHIGGFRARWRGLGLSILYHGLHGMISNLLSGFLGFGLFGHVFAYTLVSLGLARLHMAWTHSMIAYPSAKPFWRRVVPRKQCKAILLPSLVFALAQQATFILPIGVAFALGAHNINHENVMHAARHEGCGKMALMGLRFLAVPATALFIALAVLLPAAVTLTRIEATLLPEDQETIVPFDKEAIMQDIDVSARGGCKKLFVEAWRSFDRSARLRLIKLYAKMALIQFTVVIVAAHLVVVEVYVLGGERLVTFFKSAAAQLQLMAVEAQQQAPMEQMAGN